MELIDVIVVELKKRLDELWNLLPNASDVIKGNYTKEEANIIGKYSALESFSEFINTLEVKEIDLDKEITDFINNHYTICFDNNTLQNDEFDFLTTTDFEKIAKYFFELGLKTQKEE